LVNDFGFQVSGFKVQALVSRRWLLAPGSWLRVKHKPQRKAHGIENIKINVVFYFLTLCAIRHALCLLFVDTRNLLYLPLDIGYSPPLASSQQPATSDE
jgi:hypothetical protein